MYSFISYYSRRLVGKCLFPHEKHYFFRGHSTLTTTQMQNNKSHRYISSVASRCNLLVTRHPMIEHPLNIQIRTFKNVAEYHDIADDTLHNIQDALEELIEDKFLSDGDDDDIPEVNYSNGVLTIYLPPHGTWVINKQTPNEQLWWSSPISGPRRYEYVEERGRWVYTRIIDGEGSDDFLSSEGEDDTLGRILVQEIKKLYDCDLDLAA